MIEYKDPLALPAAPKVALVQSILITVALEYADVNVVETKYCKKDVSDHAAALRILFAVDNPITIYSQTHFTYSGTRDKS